LATKYHLPYLEIQQVNGLGTSQHTQAVELLATVLRTSPHILHDFQLVEAGKERCLLQTKQSTERPFSSHKFIFFTDTTNWLREVFKYTVTFCRANYTLGKGPDHKQFNMRVVQTHIKYWYLGFYTTQHNNKIPHYMYHHNALYL
jgi:hypothetical protein